MRPTISIALTIKNEAHNLGSFFGSLGSLPSEVVVVDTGSTDGSVKLLNSHAHSLPYPVRIETFHEEPFHYGRAKNKAIMAATGAYIFVLDADERLTPQLCERLSAFLTERKPTAIKLPRQDELVPHLRDPQVRVFRNGAGIKYGEDEDSRVHERLSVSPDASLEVPFLHIQGPRHWLRNPGRIRQQLALEVLRTPNTRGLLRECARGVLGFGYKFKKIYRDTYRDGLRGFAYAFLKGWYDLLLHVKVGLKPRQ